MVNFNLPNDQIRLLISILITFPMGIIFFSIKNPTVRMALGMTLGLLCQFFMYGLASLNLIVTTLACLCILSFSNREKVGNYTTVYVFTHLSILHLYRMYYDYGGWSMDITTIYMMSVCKFTAFAYCYADGGREESSLLPRYKIYAVKSYTVLEYASYIFFYSTCIMGPFFEFKDYKDFIHLRNDYENIPKLRSILTGLKKLAISLIYIGIYISLKDLMTVQSYFAQKEISTRMFYLALMYFVKYKYYTGFLFAEAPSAVCGLAFQRIKKENETIEENYERIKSINLIGVETITSVQIFFHNWNVSVHKWLKSYVHSRQLDGIQHVTNPQTKTNMRLKAKAMTFMVSAFWHGFYPSYYIVFGHFILGIIAEEKVNNIKANSKSKLTHFIVNTYFAICFLSLNVYLFGIMDALHLPIMVKFMWSLYFIPSILVFLGLFLADLVIKRNKIKRN